MKDRMSRKIFILLLRLVLGAFVLNAVAVGVFIGRSHFAVLPPAPDTMTSGAAVVFFSHPADDARLHTAVSLHQSNRVQTLVFVGGCRPRQDYFGSAVLRDRAADAGIPQDQLRIGRGSFDTIGNIDALARIAAREDYTSLTLVSSTPHLLRIRSALKNRLPSDLNIFYAPTPDEGVRSLIWQHQHEVIQALTTALLPDDLYRLALRRRRLGPGPFDETGLCTALMGA